MMPSFNLDDFTWYAEPAQRDVIEVESSWVSDEIPVGFRIISTTSKEPSGSGSAVTHILYGDGLATVSVFIAEKNFKAFPTCRIKIKRTNIL